MPAQAITPAYFAQHPLPKPGDGGKEDRGELLVFAGSSEIAGAALLSANAAFRAGAGKVTVLTCATIALQVGIALPEARVIAINLDEPLSPEMLPATPAAILAGPGLVKSQLLNEQILQLLSAYPGVPSVLDAGAMDAVNDPSFHHHGPLVMTPHFGEMASLRSKSADDIAREPQHHAACAAQSWQSVVALKSSVTWIATLRGDIFRHEGGNPGMGISGSGDVLAGIIGGLMARGTQALDAAIWGVAAHARTGELLAQTQPIGYLPREMLPQIPVALSQMA